MFSKKIVIIAGVIVLIAINIIALFVANRRYHSFGSGQFAISFIAPFQDATTHSISFVKGIWNRYFFLVSVQEENNNLRKALSSAIEKNNQYTEIETSNYRLRNILNFRKTMAEKVIVAEVIGKDPCPWFKTIIIDKGKSDGVLKGLPVVAPEGIAGQVTDVSFHYSKVLLIIDQISAVDALVQRTRSRGIIMGESAGRCILNYVLRKHDIKVGDTVISSGLDGVYPKGLRVGSVSGVIKHNSGMFQDVAVTPYINFEKLEEVIVILNPRKHAGFRSDVSGQ